MIHFGQRHCKEIIVRLAEEFWAKQKSELTKISGEITHDIINRGLFNSTGRVSELTGVHYKFIDRLAEFLIESLERDYPHISPSKCKGQLCDIVESEFEKVARRVPGWLHESQMLDEGTCRAFEEGVQTKKKEAKSHLENKCSLWEERWRRKRKWYRDPKWVVGIAVAVVAGVVVPVIGWFVSGWLRGNAGRVDPEAPSKIIRNTPLDPNTGKTVLYARTERRVDEFRDFLIKEKITPWLLMKSGGKVTNHDGKILQYSSVEFEGTPRLVFWEGFIEPFLEDGIQDVLDKVGKECVDAGLDPQNPLREAASLLRGVVWSVYRKMAEVDQTLRGKGYPNGVQRKNVDLETKTMEVKLNEYLGAVLMLYGKTLKQDNEIQQ